MLSTIGRDLGIFTTAATNTLVAASLLSIVLNPLLYRAVGPAERWIAARPRLWRAMNRRASRHVDDGGPAEARAGATTHRAVVIGYGPTGRTVVRLLRDNQIAPTVVELNMDSVRGLQHEGIDAVYGDATRPEILRAADLASAGSLILTSAGMALSTEAIRAARQLSPNVRVLARAAYLRDLSPLKEAGADSAYSGEGEVALAFVEDILETLGATPEQIERGRARAHGQLFG